MANPVKTYEYRIDVIPSLIRSREERFHDFNYRTCDDIKSEIERYCASIIDEVNIEVIVKFECPHCGLEWEEDDDGSPMCCKQAWKEWAIASGAPDFIDTDGVHPIEELDTVEWDVS